MHKLLFEEVTTPSLSQLLVTLTLVSDREVHKQHSLLSDLQLRQQNYSSLAVPMHKVTHSHASLKQTK